MTDCERLWTGIALSLFLHFSLALHKGAETENRLPFHTVLEMAGESSPAQNSARAGTGMESAAPPDSDEAERLDRRRRAYLRYIAEVERAIHARRLDGGERGLIGVALCAFTITPDGRFQDIALARPSGDRNLDASALRAVRAASGVIPRPALIGEGPLHVSLQVKYQYALE